MTLSERIGKLSKIGPAQRFCFGVPLRFLQADNPFATQDDFTEVEAKEILKDLWANLGFGLLKDQTLAMEAFVFAMVFGEDVAAWLLAEAATLGKVERSYCMRRPSDGIEINARLAFRLSNVGQALETFRMLEAGYIGWLNRV